MRKVLWTLAVAALGGLAYLALWPVPIEPVAWKPAPSLGYSGVHEPNKLLASLQAIALGGEEGPEHVVLRDGRLYVAVASGKILRMAPDGSAQEEFARTGGRVLGFDFDAAGHLIAADAMKGLLSIAPDGKVTVLVDRFGGQPIRYADAVVVARNGKVYFSDASTRFGPADSGGTFEASILDVFEQSSTGRILEYDPATQATRIVVKGLSFANGVALSNEQRFLYVAETGRYRIWQVAVEADNLDVRSGRPEARVLFDNLPGYPDNLMRGLDGRTWVGLVKPRSAAVDHLADKPLLRKVTLRLPRIMWPVPTAYGHVMAFDDAGRIVAVLQDPSGAYPETTGITETEERLYVQSLHAKALGWRPR